MCSKMKFQLFDNQKQFGYQVSPSGKQ
uniref:Uncharacterized protein n=1 Tax=Arundo donax TaxID=35708 RepID=A0A0A8ZVJ5_ARUDO